MDPHLVWIGPNVDSTKTRPNNSQKTALRCTTLTEDRFTLYNSHRRPLYNSHRRPLYNSHKRPLYAVQPSQKTALQLTEDRFTTLTEDCFTTLTEDHFTLYNSHRRPLYNSHRRPLYAVQLSQKTALRYITCHLADANLSKATHSRRHTHLGAMWGLRGLAQGVDLIMASPGMEPPTLRVQVKHLNHCATGCPCPTHLFW